MSVGWADWRMVTRRDAIALGAGSVASLAFARAGDPPIRPSVHPPNRLKQSASRWCYRSIPLPDLCKAGKSMGLSGIDLLASDDWPVVRGHGLVCSMGYAALRDDFIPRGCNDPANHDLLVGELERALPLAQQHGVANLIAMFGNRQGRSDAQARSEERRVGKECRSRWSPYQWKKNRRLDLVARPDRWRAREAVGCSFGGPLV